MKFCLVGILIVGCAGCTMMSLERHTVAQTDSAVALRYHEVLDNLALIAKDPSALPSYASIFSGTIFVQDQGQLGSTNIWPFTGAVASGSIAGASSLNRQISQNWALDPISAPEKLEAMRAACQWAIGGPDQVTPESRKLLIRPDEAPLGRIVILASQIGWRCCRRDGSASGGSRMSPFALVTRPTSATPGCG